MHIYTNYSLLFPDYSQIVLKVFKLTCLNHWLEELTEEEAKHEYKGLTFFVQSQAISARP